MAAQSACAVSLGPEREEALLSLARDSRAAQDAAERCGEVPFAARSVHKLGALYSGLLRMHFPRGAIEHCLRNPCVQTQHDALLRLLLHLSPEELPAEVAPAWLGERRRAPGEDPAVEQPAAPPSLTSASPLGAGAPEGPADSAGGQARGELGEEQRAPVPSEPALPGAAEQREAAPAGALARGEGGAAEAVPADAQPAASDPDQPAGEALHAPSATEGAEDHARKKGKKEKKPPKKGPNQLKLQLQQKKQQEDEARRRKAEQREAALAAGRKPPREEIAPKWSGKMPTEHLRDYLARYKLGRAWFERLRKQEGDGPRVRVVCVCELKAEQPQQARGKGGGAPAAERVEHSDGRAWPDERHAKEAAATLALFNLLREKQMPLYRGLPPEFRDMWLAWAAEEEQVAREERDDSDRARAAFVQDVTAREQEWLRGARWADPAPRPTDPLMPAAAAAGAPQCPDSWEDEEGAGQEARDEEGAGQEERDAGCDGEGSASPAEDAAECSALGTRLRRQWEARGRAPGAEEMARQRAELPIAAHREELLRLVQHNRCVVVSGETGCGKTTQLPQFLLEEAMGSGRGGEINIVCTQPRRLSALSVAQRVADELGVPVDSSESVVGYHVRRHRRVSQCCRLTFCTTGILLRMLQGDSTLGAFTHIIVDEAHERSTLSDFLLVVLRDLLGCRPALRVILMSATINPEQFAAYFLGAAIISIPGRTFPVTQLWLEDVIERTGYRPEWRWQELDEEARAQDRRAEGLAAIAQGGAYSEPTVATLQRLDEAAVSADLIVRCLELIVDDHPGCPGGVLVFLSGLQEINALISALAQHTLFGDSRRYRVFGLHSLMAPHEQQDALRPLGHGRRKIVAATNIAETSVTIPDISFVVDTGRMKEVRYEAHSKLRCLAEGWVSRSAAQQRRGRAGRVREGWCYALYSSAQHALLPEHQAAEMLRHPLEDLCLQILSLGIGGSGGVRGFLRRALSPPADAHVTAAMDLLADIGALATGSGEELTALGQLLAQLPLDVRLGKLLIFGAVLGCASPVATVAAALSVKSPFLATPGHAADSQAEFAGSGGSDHLALWRAYSQWSAARGAGQEAAFCREKGLSAKTMATIAETRTELLDHLSELGLLREGADRNSQDTRMLGAALCAGLAPNIAKAEVLRGGLRFLTREGDVLIHPGSCNASATRLPSPWLVFSEKVRSSRVFIRDCTPVPPAAVLLFGGSIACQLRTPQLTVAGWARFACPGRTQAALLCFRELLDQLVQAELGASRHWRGPPPPRLSEAQRRAILSNLSRLIAQ
eukprot:TRINITY_DN5767_c0_g3_i1.p1 TRINITY_DN5767_c0_g3~~TRINITY_DN5767_c0_g3_i1.p1  ORF type:complete len:1315 (+),score=391.93 TRINITY_DN5767_c0_g3_i1:64-3945(+)